MITEDLKTAVIDIASSGVNILITAGGTGTYIAIDHINLLPVTAVTVTFNSGHVALNELSGPYSLDAKQALTLENAMQAQKGVITCQSGQDFVIQLGASVQVSGFIRYSIVNL